MTVRTPIRKGHGRLSMLPSAPFLGELLQAASPARYDLDPAGWDQVVGVLPTQAGRQALTERVCPRRPA
jgi:hypothetical protein